MRTAKTLDEKLARIRGGRYTAKDFIIADAKDGDMALGVGTAGPELDADGKPTGRMRPIKVYRDGMEEMVASGEIDVMLTSLSSAEYLTRRGVYADTAVTPAVRLNDGSDIWHWRGADYKRLPTVPFRTARLDRVKPVADLGLYAVTFFNDLDQDRRTLDAYAAFRDEASAAGVRHFLEIFNPQFEVKCVDADFATYNNDAIARCLAGVSVHERPEFLKVVYNGPAATEALASYDPENIIVGILGGASSTTRDTFELIKQAEKYGARVALFGRKIFFAEDPVGIVRAMRALIEEDASPEDMVKRYHDGLKKAGIRPKQSMEKDLEVTDPACRLGLGL
jgi:DhnA family fructose-bisphosphate aldolase class Ia